MALDVADGQTDEQCFGRGWACDDVLAVDLHAQHPLPDDVAGNALADTLDFREFWHEVILAGCVKGVVMSGVICCQNPLCVWVGVWVPHSIRRRGVSLAY